MGVLLILIPLTILAKIKIITYHAGIAKMKQNTFVISVVLIYVKNAIITENIKILKNIQIINILK
jgi:hypothetical protein